MADYQQKIKFINHCVPQDVYREMKPSIKDFFSREAQRILPWDFQMTVHIRPNPKEIQGIQAAVAIVKPNAYRFIVYESAILALNHGKSRFFASIVMHEFQHLRDLQFAVSCPYHDFIFSGKRPESKRDFFAHKGFSFWMEINAYQVFYYYCNKRDIDNPTFYQLCKTYQRAEKAASALKSYDAEDGYGQCEEFLEALDTFSYLFTKYLGRSRLDEVRRSYSKKVRNLGEFRHLRRFERKINGVLKKIDRQPFGKKFNRNFARLGKAVYKYCYEPFRWKVEECEKGVAQVCYL